MSQIPTGDLVALRRDLHRHPELGHQEHRTQRVVMAHLAESGLVARPIAGTGVVALLEGPAPGPTLLLRADMDALPIQEESEHDYASLTPGVMHACGHDAHTAMLLFVARTLARRGLARGAVKFVFQPAEEGLGGAARLLDEGILRDPVPDVALAFHVWSPYPTGQVVALDGAATAHVDGFRIRVSGRGTHAATPEDGVDPLLIAAHIITAAQSLVSRRSSPHDAVVLTFGGLSGADAWNVIPGHVVLSGTIRSFDAALRDRVRGELTEMAAGIAQVMRGRADYEQPTQHVAVLNDPSVAARVRQVVVETLGPAALATPRPLMVGEDFGEILEQVPGALVMLGCGDPAADLVQPHHHPRFDIDERVLPLGVELALRLVERFLSAEAQIPAPASNCS